MAKATSAIIPGSIASVSERRNISLAESFIEADALICLDVSSSMGEHDAPSGRTRYEFGCEQLTRVQGENPGKCALISYSSYPQFIPGGVAPFSGGSTNLTAALEFIAIADGTMKVIIISDGYPDNAETALAVASRFKSKIDTIFCGSETDATGRDFLRRLAAASGGIAADSFKATDLGKTVGLLLKAG